MLQDGAVLGKTFTRDALAALSGIAEARARAPARRRSCARRCSACRPTRARRSTASTASCRTSSATSPTRRCRSASARAGISPPPSTSRAASPATRTRWSRCSPRTTSPPTRPRPMRTTPPRSGSKAREMLARAGERAASLAAAAEAQRYFEQAAELDRRAARAGGSCSSGPARWPGGPAIPRRRGACSKRRSRSTSARATRSAAARVVGAARATFDFTGRREEAVARMERAFEVISAGRAGRGPRRCSPRRLGRNYWFSGDLERAPSGPSWRSTSPRRYGYPEPLVMALRAKGGVAFSRGHTEEALALIRHALALALEHELADDAAHVLLHPLGPRASEATRYARRSGTSRRRSSWRAEVGESPYEWATLAEATYPLCMLGRWDEALATAAESDRGAYAVGRRDAQPAPAGRRDPRAARRTRRGSPDVLAVRATSRAPSDVQDRASATSARGRLLPAPRAALRRRSPTPGPRSRRRHARVRPAGRQAGVVDAARGGAGARRPRGKARS